MVTNTKKLYDRHGVLVGWGDTVCFPLGNSSAQCLGTFVLPKGKINVAGTRHNTAFFAFAIVGGTGRYVGWGGTLVGRTVSYRTEKLVFEGLAP
jgi:hypothetical protein